MRLIKSILPKAVIFFFICTIFCGGVYTVLITGVAQCIFPKQANGSIIEIEGKKYGSELLGQNYNDESHMWGRIMNIDVSTYKDEDGKILMYSSPSNLSPTSEEFKKLVAERIEIIKNINPEMDEKAIPVDLVTSSGSGLDPQISVAAAEYQISRLAKNTGRSEEDVKNIIKECTTNKFLGIFGEKTVNVLEVNLMLDKILK